MVKVLHVITTINRGGAENQLVVLVREQIKLGMDVSVIYLKGEPELEGELKSAGAKVLHGIANKNPLQQLWRLKSIVKKDRPLIHGHLPRAELVARFSAGQNRLIVSRHNAEPFFPGALQVLSSFLSRVVVKRASSVIAISHAVAEFLVAADELRDKKKLVVIHYGYQPHMNEARVSSKTSIGSHEITIGTISRLTRQKDLPTLFSAFAKFLKDFPKAKLLIVGDGVEKSALKALATELKIAEHIEWAGRTSQIPEYLSRMDTFILSSLYEGFGLVLLEAMDAGVPIVASNNSAIPEVLGNEFPGLTRTGYVDDFYQKMVRCAEPNFRGRVLEIQAERLAKFQAPEMCRKIDEVYSRH